MVPDTVGYDGVVAEESFALNDGIDDVVDGAKECCVVE